MALTKQHSLGHSVKSPCKERALSSKILKSSKKSKRIKPMLQNSKIMLQLRSLSSPQLQLKRLFLLAQ